MTQEKPKQTPNTVISAKYVRLALITYVNEWGESVTQLGVVGDENIQMLDSSILGFSKTRTPVGLATKWLKEGAFKLLTVTKKAVSKVKGKLNESK